MRNIVFTFSPMQRSGMNFTAAYTRRTPVLCALLILLALLATGCGGRVASETIRQELLSGDLDTLSEKLADTQESYGDFVSSLNYARVLQLRSQWKDSIGMYDTALNLLEGYEDRAIVSVRSVAADVGTLLLSRGAAEYYGTGYERSLLHTFNALNYAMLGDFSGASVEMRKMDKRQELWLEESEARIKAFMKENANAHSADDLPAQYSMREILQDKAVRDRVNNYQDAFSYALSAILFRISGDMQGADVNMRRAQSLDDHADQLFRSTWGKRTGTSAKKHVSIPPLFSYEQLASGTSAKGNIKKATQEANKHQEVTILAFGGLGPSLRQENVRVFFPYVGYLLVDLPAYSRPIGSPAPAVSAHAQHITFHPLLHTDILAYRTLKDELHYEIGSAISRAATRAGISTGAYALARSNENTRDLAPLIGFLTTAMLDLFSTTMGDSLRNWETLPNVGYLAMTTVPRGSTVTIGSNNAAQSIDLPHDARGVIIMVTSLSNSNLKVNHVAY